MRDVEELDIEELRDIVRCVQEVLWFDRRRWDPDKEWEWEDIEYVAETLINYGLKPEAEKEDNDHG